jgi:hypothetical protein
MKLTEDTARKVAIDEADSSIRLVPIALTEKAAQWRKVLSDADRGPLIVAADVVALADRWDDYESEAGGLSITGWLRKNLGAGRGLAWFERRAKAVRVLGEASRRNLNHGVAVWVSENVPPSQFDAAKRVLYHGARAQNGVPLTLGQARPLLIAELGDLFSARGYQSKLSDALARLDRIEVWARAKGLTLPE